MVPIIDGILGNDDGVYAHRAEQDKAPPPQRAVPTSNDILCGTGHERNHPGNSLFKRAVFPFVGAYAKAELKAEKMSIVKRIVNLLSDKGMRFLKKSSVYKYWYVASQKVGRDKIGHFLRLHHPTKSAIVPMAVLSSSLLPSSVSGALQQQEGGARTSAFIPPGGGWEEVHEHNSSSAQISTSTSSILGSSVLSSTTLAGAPHQRYSNSIKIPPDELIASTMLYYSAKRANQCQFPKHCYHQAACNERHNNPYQVGHGTYVFSTSKYPNPYDEPDELQLPYSSRNGSTSTGNGATVYERQDFDSQFLKNTPALPTTNAYNMKKDLHDKLLNNLKTTDFKRVFLAANHDAKYNRWLRAGSSTNGIPPSALVNMMEEGWTTKSPSCSIMDDIQTKIVLPNIERGFGVGSVDQPSPVLSGSMMLPHNGDEDSLFGEQDLAARLDWLSNGFK
jgi:hypothetical protein